MTQLPRRLLMEHANEARTRPTTRTIDSLLVEEQEFEPTTRGYSLVSDSVTVPPDVERLNNYVEPEVKETRPRPIIKWNSTCIQSLIYPFAIVMYLLIGALVFMVIENENDKQIIQSAREQRESLRAFLNQVSNLTENQIDEIFKNFTILCNNDALHNMSTTRWDFVPSFMFVTTSITTIGYGLTSPATSGGRVFLCFYALMGIPLFLVYMATVGKSLAGVWDALVARVPRNSRTMKKLIEVISIPVLIVFAFAIVVFFPALLFQHTESQWTYTEAVYFTIVSLTTIGYGDYVPAARHLKQPNYVLLYVTWLFVGLAIVSLLVAKMADVYSKVEQFTVKKSKNRLTECLLMKNRHQAKREDNNNIVELSGSYVPMD